MNAEQILKLLDAGYTKADIDALSGTPDPQVTPDPEPEAPETPAEPEPAPAVPDHTSERLDRIESVLEQLANASIRGSEAPEPKERENVVAEVLKHL